MVSHWCAYVPIMHMALVRPGRSVMYLGKRHVRGCAHDPLRSVQRATEPARGLPGAF